MKIIGNMPLYGEISINITLEMCRESITTDILEELIEDSLKFVLVLPVLS